MMYNSTFNQSFLVHKADGTRVFRCSKNALFFTEVKNDVGHIFINTVECRKSKFTIKVYADSVHAHSLQDIIGWPSTIDFICVHASAEEELEELYSKADDADN